MTSRKRTLSWLMVLILLVGAFQLACALTRKETPTPESTQLPTEAAVETSAPTKIPPTKISPTNTPSPSPTPLPPLPPQIISRSPARGEESLVDAPLVIRFDQPMKKSSVEAAFEIEPDVPGELSWADDRTLVFQPAEQFQRQSRYDVTIAQTASSQAGLAAEVPYSFRFQTVGFLNVSQVLPSDAAENVDVDATITVMFNRPVVPLVHSSQISDLPHPLQLNPPVKGEGEWLNTSIYVFRPASQLAAGTQYRATIQAGLEDLTGGILSEDFSWTFTTQEPTITWFQPSDGEYKIGLTGNISVTFNQPMDPDTVKAAFRIVDDDGVTPRGRFAWNEDYTVMGWYPSSLLDMESHYTWELDRQAQSAAGAAQLRDGLAAEFWTVSYPALLFTSPSDGELSADPYGGLELYFASPMDPNTILPNLTIIPEPTDVYTWYDSWDDRFYVGFSKLASTDYAVTVGADMADPYGNTLGYDTEIEFTTAQLPAMAYLNTPGRVGTYNAYTPTVVFAVYRNVSQLDMTLARLEVDDLIELTGPDSWQKWDDFWPAQDNILRQWSVDVENVLNDTSVWRIPLANQAAGQLSPGIYYLHMTSPGFLKWDISDHLLVISPINLTFKQSSDEVLVWATDLVSGQPVPDLPVSVYDENGDIVAAGTTDEDGLYIDSIDEAHDWLYAVSGEPGADDFAFSSNNWTNGISSWDFNLQYEDYAHQNTKIYLYTDRPIYRPGHTIYFKGILRDPDEARYLLPDLTEIEIEAYDWQDTLIYRETLPVTEMGTFAGQIQLSEDAKTGNYHFVIDPEGVRRWQYFSVAEYRKPEFEVNVTPENDQLVAGDRLRTLVEAAYYFGGPVDEANVEWYIFADSYAFQGPGRYSYQDYQDWYWYAWDDSYYYGYGAQIADGTGTTDSKGQFIINQKADLGDETGAQLWTIEATIVDINQQRVTGRSQAVVHPAAQYAGIYADRYVGKVNEEQSVNVIIVDLSGNPIPDAQATVVAYQREWFNVQVEEDGYTRWEWTVVETPVFTDTIEMDANGKGVVSYTPEEGGSYRLRAITTDQAGRENRASAFLWVSSSQYVSWRMENNDRIELIADSDNYKPGDVAEILIPSPFQGVVKALVTVERGRFFQQEIITLQSNSEIYRLPITADHAPTVFVSVVLIKGIDETNMISSFKMGMVQLNVSTEQQELNIELTPDKDAYGPGDTVTYDILVTDYQNEPVETELSLALVDLSVLALAPDQAEPILDAFYSERGIGVQTAVGLVLNVDRLNEEIADKAKGGGGGGDEAAMGIGLEVRTEFPDTAY
ncbi:MAG: Ig-like domain-containing protein, partial [Anaerolineales bacterium]|nr:Ig-like domain-containing protein [Anaerolineales bacterium]